MTSSKSQRLELTWFNKDKALIPTENGKYGYSWVDPRDPRYCETHTLVEGEYIEGIQAKKEDGRSYSELADLEPTTDNLLINGESGDVLKALTRVPELADKYLGKIKLCYIDPPFNTEKTFTHYEDNLEHSVWLTMMRDRLVHIKKLLSDDGSIWVHLDDSENHRMRVLLDEVFGPGNFVAEIIWEKSFSPKNSAKYFSGDHDVVLVYAKLKTLWAPNALPRTAAMDALYSNPDDDSRGVWTSGDFVANKPYSLGLYSITTPSGRTIEGPPKGRYWRVSEERLMELDADNRVWWGPEGDSVPRYKRFLTEVRGAVPRTLWKHVQVGHNDSAKKEIQALFPDTEAFDTPKPERFLERVIHIASNPGDTVLDVFAGSGTTAAVAHKMGRRWVTCELSNDNFESFALPRLTKVVRGEDPGGITATAGERVDATEEGLPEGLSPDEAQKLTSLLNKAVRDDEELKKDPALRKVKALVKTRKSLDTINWRGGGGFRVATLSPECFDYDPDLGLASLTDAAFAGDNLACAVAAHMNFHLTPEHPVFTGKRGRTRILVTTADATPEYVDELVPHLDHDEKLVLASTSVDPDAQQVLRKARRGSRVVHIPNDLFRVHEIEG